MRIPWLLIIFLGGLVAIGAYDDDFGCKLVNGCRPMQGPAATGVPDYSQFSPPTQ